MPLGLHADCLARLREVVADAIPRLEVQQGMFLTAESFGHLFTADAALEQRGAIHDRLLAWIGDTPASTFIYHRLNREILGVRRYLEQGVPASQPLQGLPSFADAGAVAVRLVDEFESLPWDYSITFAIPKTFSALFATETRRVVLSERLAIVVPDGTYETTVSDSTADGGGLLGGLTGYSPSFSSRETGASYIEMRVTGFVAPHGSTAPLDAVETTVREFSGLGIALRLFAPPRPYGRNFHQPRFTVHRKQGEAWVFDCEPLWDTDQSRTFRELELDTIFGHLATDAQKTQWMLSVLPRIARVFSSAETHRMRRGAQWLFDSFCEHDLPLAFVQAAVVMEVLLGGDRSTSDAVGLAELLSSRLAYLVGTSPTDREHVASEFKDIYDVRSRIIHEGKSTLSTREHEQLIQLRNLCRRVIFREMDLLDAAAERPRVTR